MKNNAGRFSLIGCVFICCAFGGAKAAAQATLQNLGRLPGRPNESYIVPHAISDDGQVIVGEVFLISDPLPNYWVAFRWTEVGGMQLLLSSLPAGSRSHALDVSADGSVVVGWIEFPQGDSRGNQAFRWTQSDGLVLLGTFDSDPGLPTSAANRITADGAIIVGNAESDLGLQAFRLTSDEVFLPLGDLPGGRFYSAAIAASFDASVIAGRSYVDSPLGDSFQAFRWTAETGMVGLGYLPTPSDVLPRSYATAVSADGSIIAGESHSLARHSNVNDVEAFRWTASGGMQSLSAPNPVGPSYARAMSADGKYVFGSAYIPTNAGYVWSQDLGMRDLAIVIQEIFNVDLRTELTSPLAVTPDGRTIVSWNPQWGAWRLRLDFPCPGDIDNDDFVQIADLVLLLGNFGESGTNLPGDFDANGTVEISDLATLLAAFGRDCRW